MKLTEMDLPAPVGHGEAAGWIPMPEPFPMQSHRQSMATIKGVSHNDCNDIKSVSGVNNDSVCGWAVKHDHETFGATFAEFTALRVIYFRQRRDCRHAFSLSTANANKIRAEGLPTETADVKTAEQS